MPTARYETFGDVASAEAYLRSMAPPYVVKTDGLAAGKGVLVTRDLDEAVADVARQALAARPSATAGESVVIEEGLAGPECSLFVLCDGASAVALAPSRDYKRVGDGDAGANTGGMGAYAPLPELGDGVLADVMDRGDRPDAWPSCAAAASTTAASSTPG